MSNKTRYQARFILKFVLIMFGLYWFFNWDTCLRLSKYHEYEVTPVGRSSILIKRLGGKELIIGDTIFIEGEGLFVVKKRLK